MTWGPKRDSDPEPLGVTIKGDGVNVAVFSANATAIEFCLFEGEREVRRVRLRGRTGDVHHDHVDGVPPGAHYGLRAHGPFAPREGHVFNPAKLLIDPYARAIDRALRRHPSMFAVGTDQPAPELTPDDTDSAPFVPKAIVLPAGRSSPAAARLTPWSRTVLYELHVRGFTIRHPAVPEPLRGTFAGLAHPAAIEHLTRLGVTSVEIMPAAAWIEERHLAARGSRNYWGYNPIAFMAPDPGLAPGGWDEISATVAALAAAGIETILDVVLNHTGEGDVHGPTLSLRGLDNATYYRLSPDEPWRYADDTGCGHTLALDRPAPLRLAMDSLRVWAQQAGLHGFRFDLAPVLGRRDDGFDPAAPLLSAIAQDPVLRELKLIAEPWDPGPGGYQIGRFPGDWGEWNDRFRDSTRRFWRGDDGQLGDLATRLSGSSDLFAAHRLASRSVNFVVAHDGFTLADLVSYTDKHNEANGEDNRDGTDSNCSWNNGAEGETDDPAIIAARLRDQRALLATLILARGTPMLAMGAEFGQSQGGNNNVYAQDNPTAWLDWSRVDAELLDWTRLLLRLRREHAPLRDDRFLTGTARDISLFPDVEWRDAAGQITTSEAWDADTLMMSLASPSDDADTIDRVSVIFHRGGDDARVELPPPRAGYIWNVLADSAGRQRGSNTEPAIDVSARSVVVLAEQPETPHARPAADPALLHRLAEAAGIAPEWLDMRGNRTVVSDETRRALLAAMRLPATSEGEARDTLRRLSEDLDRRPLPHAIVTRGEEPIVARMPVEPDIGRRPLWLTVETEDGDKRRIKIGADDGDLAGSTGIDGRPGQIWRVPLPALPEGRHRLWRDDAPGAVCHLTVAPAQCHVPDAFRRGEKRFGVSAQLYALRRKNDRGIGDFTTLALLAEAAGPKGAATIGINPLHMLFPGQRERASPYHPSDRRFLDPIYLDIGPEVTKAARDGDHVAWSDVWVAKKAALEHCHAEFLVRKKADPSSAEPFEDFVRAGGVDLWRFAVFQAIAETQPTENWRDWPAELGAYDSKDVAAFAQSHADRVGFHQYAQFLADRQLGAAAARVAAAGLEIGIYRDLAVGAAPDGAESWSRAEHLADGAWVGAPPDPLAPEGQNWFLPPPLPLSFPRDGYAGFSNLIGANMRHAGALRIDHVMALSRLFWIPDGAHGREGAYVSYPLADLIGQVALESARSRCMIIGEDLGTVPDGFRETLSDAGIFSYRVLLLEREGTAYQPAASFPELSVACVTTHDLPTLAGWWEGVDLRERVDLGLLPSGPEAEAERAAERSGLADALIKDGGLETKESPAAAAVASAYAFIAATPSGLALVEAPDLAGMRTAVNLPGTDTQRPNWRLRVPEPVETLLSSEAAGTILKSMHAHGRGKPVK